MPPIGAHRRPGRKREKVLLTRFLNRLVPTARVQHELHSILGGAVMPDET